MATSNGLTIDAGRSQEYRENYLMEIHDSLIPAIAQHGDE
jgi:hypothetical protein